MRIESNLPSRSPAADDIRQQSAQRASARKEAAAAAKAQEALTAKVAETDGTNGTNGSQAAAPAAANATISADTGIADSDAAAQAVQFASNAIVTQPSSALLAQASLLPQGALRLLV